MKRTPLEVLRSSTLLRSLPEDDLVDLADASRIAEASRGEVIWMDGKHADYFGIVARVFVKMTMSTAKGQDLTTEIMGPGQVFGLLGTIDGSGCPQTARAVCHCSYLQVPKVPFLRYYPTDVVLKERLVSRTTTRLRRAHEMLARMSAGRVETRIAAILLLLAESYGEPEGDSMNLSVPLTRQEIADMAGTTVETTIRITSQWQKSGWVKARGSHWNLLQIAKLEDLLIA